MLIRSAKGHIKKDCPFILFLFFLLCLAIFSGGFALSEIKSNTGIEMDTGFKDYKNEYVNLNPARNTLYIDNNECKYIIRDLPNPKGEGNLTFEFLLFDASDGFYKTIETKDISCYEYCKVFDPEDPNVDLALSPIPWGEYPYGFWRCKIYLNETYFKNNNNWVYLTVKLPGSINPLNAEYFTQRLDTENNKIEWEELSKDSTGFFIDSWARTINIRLYDIIDIKHDDIEDGYSVIDPNKAGDINADKWVIEHIGGLVWPIPEKGRCFITTIR